MRNFFSILILFIFLPNLALADWWPNIDDFGQLLGHCYSAEPNCYDVIPLVDPQNSCYVIDIYYSAGSLFGPPFCLSMAEIEVGSACYDLEVYLYFWDPYIQSENEALIGLWPTTYNPFFSSTAVLTGSNLLFTVFLDGIELTTNGTVDVYIDGLTYVGTFSNPLNIAALDLSSAIGYTFFQFNSAELDGCFNTLQSYYLHYNYVPSVGHGGRGGHRRGVDGEQSITDHSVGGAYERRLP